MSLNKKGMSTVLLVIISATVLLLFAMSLVTLGRFQLENFLGSTRELETRGTCLNWRQKLIREQNPDLMVEKGEYCGELAEYNQRCKHKTGELQVNCDYTQFDD